MEVHRLVDVHSGVEGPGGCPAPPEGTVVTIGAYDGVHLGHRAVIAAVRERAAAGGHRSAVVTFDRHPAQVIRPDSAPLLLTDLDQKLELLEDTGVDHVLVVHFDEQRAAESAEDFVDRVLVGCLNAKQVVVGEDFHFGHRRRGNVALLEEQGEALGFGVHGHKLVGPDGHAARDDAQVSSTAIRRALIEGRLADANAMLGRPHEMRGPVAHGDARGRTLGFPTANVAIRPEMLMPADGIYAGEMELRDTGEVLPSAVYVGKRPTFYNDTAMTLLEVHALDFAGDLYDRDVAVRFTHRIRPDARFASVEELTVQLRADCDEAARLLNLR
ncbi:bifunctional riboflavin kinase/FAD synthetase [Dermatobacter hominis]|uniref:bifunctional riboflavin kinase/FAD synthetase n=1 Tax=Dermatobacter hominis TaxID=2884263 RepID=UPI001D10E6F1|nr:bifunctional riboflavin kinase/FAD synthetase [Dermatobacter hominis]UDY36849.1 bifunctional riboflavin kinase/FAD synthetase [Dermatobacter hominis]